MTVTPVPVYAGKSLTAIIRGFAYDSTLVVESDSGKAYDNPDGANKFRYGIGRDLRLKW